MLSVFGLQGISTACPGGLNRDAGSTFMRQMLATSLLTKSRCPPTATVFATSLDASHCASPSRYATFFGPVLGPQRSGSRSTDLPIRPHLPESGSETYRGIANFQSKDASSPLAGFRTPATPLDSRAYGLCARIHMRKDDALSQTLARRTRRQAQEFEA